MEEVVVPLGDGCDGSSDFSSAAVVPINRNVRKEEPEHFGKSEFSVG